MFTSTVLTAKQARFIDEYLVDANGTQAAIRAGYGAAGARVAAHRLLTNVAISSAIEARQKADATRLWIDRESVLAGLLEAVEMAREQRNPAGMIAGLREIGRGCAGRALYNTRTGRLVVVEGANKSGIRRDVFSSWHCILH